MRIYIFCWTRESTNHLQIRVQVRYYNGSDLGTFSVTEKREN